MLERGPSGTRKIESERLPASEINEGEVLQGSVIDDEGNILIHSQEVAIPNKEVAPYIDIEPETVTPLEFKVVGLDMNRDAKDFARDVADKRVTERIETGTEKGNWALRQVKRFGYGLFRDNMRQAEIRKAAREIEESNDVLIGLVGSEDDRAQARRGLFKRFQNTEYGDEVLKQAAGEHRDIHEEDSPLAKSIKEAYEQALISTDPKAREILGIEVARLFAANHDADPNNKGEGNARINNALENFDAMQLAIEQGATMDEVKAGIQVLSGEARIGAKTEARYDVVDKAMDKLGKLGWAGNLLPEAFVAGSVAAAVAAGKFLGGAAAAKILGVTVPGVLGAIVAGGREYRHLKLEKRQHTREYAKGGEIDPDDRRRRKIHEKSGLEQNVEDIDDTISFLAERLAEITPGEDGEKPGDKALKAALDAVAVAEFRNNVRDNDLLRDGGFVNADGQVEDFAVLRAKMKIALRHQLDDETRTRLDLLAPPADIDDIISDKTFEAASLVTLEENVSKAEKTFSRWQRNRALGVGLVGGVGGAGLSLVLPELWAAIPYVGNTHSGWAEQLWKDVPDSAHQTVLADLFGEEYGGHHSAAGDFISSHVGTAGKGSIKLSSDHNLVKNPDGSLKFVVEKTGDVTLDNIKVNPDGTLPPESLDALRGAGMDVQEMPPAEGNPIPKTEVQDVPLGQYMERHPGTPIDRNHLDYGTAGVYERAEQNLQAGLVSPDGTYHMSIAGMDRDSYDMRGNRVDWAAEAQNGTMKLAISPSKDFQGAPIMVDIQRDGSISVPPGHDAAPFLSKDADGRTVVTGAYAEAGRLGPIDPATGKARFDVSATVIGQNSVGNTVQDTVTTNVQEKYPNYQITTSGYEGPRMVTDIPWWAPIMPIKAVKPIQEPKGRPVAPPAEPTPPAPGTSLDRLSLPPVPPMRSIGGSERVLSRGGVLDVTTSGENRNSSRRRRGFNGGTRPETPAGSKGSFERGPASTRQDLAARRSPRSRRSERAAEKPVGVDRVKDAPVFSKAREYAVEFTEQLRAATPKNKRSVLAAINRDAKRLFGAGGYSIFTEGGQPKFKYNKRGLGVLKSRISVVK